MRSGDSCDCDEGWGGVNCNVCTKDSVCNAFMPDKTGGVCHQSGELVRSNHQMCKVVNKMILQLLGDQKPEVTFTCDAESEECDFQCKKNIVQTCKLY